MKDTLTLLTSEPASEQQQWFFCNSPHLTCRFTVTSRFCSPRQYRRSTGVAFFCEQCCELWARIGPIDTNDLASWVVIKRSCRTHGNGTLAWESYAACAPLRILYHDFLIASATPLDDPSHVWTFDAVRTLVTGLQDQELLSSVGT